MTAATEKLGFTCVEAGWLLSLTESQVRGLLRKGRLSYAVPRRLIDPLSVRFSLPADGWELRVIAFDALMAGRIEAPRSATRYGKPMSLMAGLLPLMAEWNGYTVHKPGESCSQRG